MLKPIFQGLSSGGERGRLSILIFHRVSQQADPVFPDEMDARRFDAVCRWLRKWGNVLPLDEAVRRLSDRTLPPRAMSITFDDGYADNHDQALPILQRHGLTATFFIATGFIGGPGMWNDMIIEALRATQRPQWSPEDLGLPDPMHQIVKLDSPQARRGVIEAVIAAAKYLPHDQRSAFAERVAAWSGAKSQQRLMMNPDQLRWLHQAGMQIGAHTVSHPILALLDATAVRAEIADSRATLESILNQPVTLFAYPNGRPGEDYSPDTAAIVRELGFSAAVTTAWGAAHSATDRFEIPRFTPWDRSRLRFGGRMLANLWVSRPQA